MNSILLVVLTSENLWINLFHLEIKKTELAEASSVCNKKPFCFRYC